MSARDFYHDAVKAALIKDGWTITDDPLHLRAGRKDLYVDLGAERLLAAQKGNEKIAVEVKSFVGLSQVSDLQQALGQFAMYRSTLRRLEPDRQLFLAIPEHVAGELFDDMIGDMIFEDNLARVVLVDVTKQEIVKWMN